MQSGATISVALWNVSFASYGLSCFFVAPDGDGVRAVSVRFRETSRGGEASEAVNADRYRLARKSSPRLPSPPANRYLMWPRAYRSIAVGPCSMSPRLRDDEAHGSAGGSLIAATLVTGLALARLARLSAAPVPNHSGSAALLRLSWSARPERIEVCRTLSHEELEEREEHMRLRVECDGRFATRKRTSCAAAASATTAPCICCAR